MTTVSTASVVITDTSVLINLSHTQHLSLLSELKTLRFVVPDEVIAEVKQPSQLRLVEEAVEIGAVSHVSISTPAELELFVELSRILGAGEAACLALAVKRSWIVASDEKRVFLREAQARLGTGRVLNTPGLYVLLIRAGVLSVRDADAAKAVLEANRFRMAFASFRDII